MQSVRDWLRWSLNITSTPVCGSPSISRMLGGGRSTSKSDLTPLEQHGQASLVLKLVETLPEPQQAALWVRTSLLPIPTLKKLARFLSPYIHPQNRYAVELSILNAAGIRGASKSAIAKTLKVRQVRGAEFAHNIQEKLDQLGKTAEYTLESMMIQRGLINQ